MKKAVLYLTLVVVFCIIAGIGVGVANMDTFAYWIRGGGIGLCIGCAFMVIILLVASFVQMGEK